MTIFDINYHNSQITSRGDDVFHNVDVFGSVKLLGESFDIVFQCGQTYYNNDYSAPSTELSVSDHGTDDFIFAMWALTESEIEEFTQDDIAEYKEMFNAINSVDDLLKIHHTINDVPKNLKKKHLWQKEHLENQTGTPNAYKPNRISKLNNLKKKYETWKN